MKNETFKAYLEKNYDAGGHHLYETRTEAELRLEFKTKLEMKAYCKRKIDQALEHRWGEDTDPELAAYERFNKDWIN